MRVRVRRGGLREGGGKEEGGEGRGRGGRMVIFPMHFLFVPYHPPAMVGCHRMVSWGTLVWGCGHWERAGGQSGPLPSLKGKGSKVEE